MAFPFLIRILLENSKSISDSNLLIQVYGASAKWQQIMERGRSFYLCELSCWILILEHS